MNGPANGILWTSDEAAAATRGDTTRPFSATGVSIDSRTIVPGDLFVALKGPNFDGHGFVAAALDRGAAAALVHDAPDDVAESAPLLMVDDTLRALEDLGRAARARGQARIAAVTGSVGKTGSKEALGRALAEQAATCASAGSLNNHWGVPLSLARLPRDARYGVFEMGMNHPGEINPLSRMARPHAALITTVEPVHLAFFRNLMEIAEAKAEVFAGLEVGGIAVLNRDNDFFDFLQQAAEWRNASRIIGFGRHPEAQARLLELRADDTGSSVRAEVMGEVLDYRVGIPGDHWVLNSLGVLATVFAIGADVPRAAGSLAALEAVAGRGRQHRIDLAGDALLVIDESYNANPASMAAALRVLGGATVGAGGRRIAVLGDMLELGAAAAQSHADLAAVVDATGIDLVFAAGPLMKALWDELPEPLRGGYAATSADLQPAVLAAVRPGDAVAVKGSLGSRMGPIVAALLALESSHDMPPRRAATGG